MKEDLDKVFKDMDEVFKQLDKVFKETDKRMEELFAGAAESPKYPWKKWFAWRPVKVKGKIKWLRNVYRQEIPKTYVTHDDWTRYKYGDIFDVLKDAN